MLRHLLLLFIIGVLCYMPVFSFAQEDVGGERLLVIREAQERRQTSVAVEVYLMDDILEVTILARMYAAKPKVYNALLVGPKLGRMSSQERQTLYPKAEDQELFFKTIDLEGGLIRFSKKTQEKKLKGTLTKELVRFRIPPKKIISDRRYQLWVQIESMQRSAQPESFKFVLKDLPQLISQ